MENDGTIPKREVVTLSDSEDDDVAEVQCFKSIHAFWPELHSVEISGFFRHSNITRNQF